MWSVPLPSFDNIQFTIFQIFLVLNLNGMCLFFSHTGMWTMVDSALCVPADVWNEVRFITL